MRFDGFPDPQLDMPAGQWSVRMSCLHGLLLGLFVSWDDTGKPSRFRTAARASLVGIVEHSVQTQSDNRAGAKLGHHGPSRAVIEHTFRAEVMKPPLQTEIARGINAMTMYELPRDCLRRSPGTIYQKSLIVCAGAWQVFSWPALDKISGFSCY